MDQGASSVPDLRVQTGAGEGCRACHCRMERLLAGLPACAWSLQSCSNCHHCGCSCEIAA